MTTIVNNPAPTGDSGGGMGMIIGVFLLVIVGIVFFVYGLPALRQLSSPQINVPDKIDVNINQEKSE